MTSIACTSAVTHSAGLMGPGAVTLLDLAVSRPEVGYNLCPRMSSGVPIQQDKWLRYLITGFKWN